MTRLPVNRHGSRPRAGVPIPAPASSFVGREREIAEIAARFAGGERLVTVLGPAGVGKTRVAVHAAATLRFERRAASAIFCDLSECGTASEVAAAVRGAIGAAPTPGADEMAHLARLLAVRGAALLLVDNVEQVVAVVAPLLARLIGGTPRLRVLATSRERLRIQGEVVVDLEPLPVPPEGDAAPDGYAAVRLLYDRARAVAPGWASGPGDAEAVAAVARRLEGFPLAIELCAPRARVLDPAALLARLDRSFDVLGAGARDVAPRHLTLARALEWSFALLSPTERAALAQCAVFGGSFTPEAAAAVLDLGEGAPPALEIVAALADKSLVRGDPDGATGRLSLYASVREHAARELDATAGREAAEVRHARYYLDLGEAAARAVDRRGRAARRVLSLERDQIAAVHGRALPVRERASDAVRAALLLDEITFGGGSVSERLAVIDAAIGAAEGAAVDPVLLSRALETRARALRVAGRDEEARRDLDRALDLAVAAGDRAAEARARSSRCVQLRSDHRLDEARAEGARALSLHREIGLPRFEIFSLGALGAIEVEAGRLDAARSLFERCAALARRIDDRWSEAMATAFQGHAHQEGRDLPAARAAFSRATKAFHDVGDLLHEAIFGGYLAGVLHEEGDHEGAREGYARAAAHLAELEVPRFEALFRACLGAVTAALGGPDEARAELAAAAALLGAVVDPALGLALEIHRLHLELPSPVGAARAVARRDALVDGNPLVAASDDVRFALRVFHAAVVATTRPPADRSPLRVGPEARWFEPRGGARVSLDRKRSLRLILAALARAHLRAPGRALDRDALLDAGWPGQRVLVDAGAQRVRVAVASLRALGLRGLLQTRDDGYLLDPAATLELTGEI